MTPKFNHILILFIIIILLSLSNQTLSVGQTPGSTSFFPIISFDPTGWIGPYGGYIVAVAVDPSNPQVVYAGSFGSGMYKSMDGGLSWQAANQGLTNLYINSLAIDPKQPSTLYAGTYRNQVYKSQDGGNSWTWSGSGMQDQAIVYTIAIDPFMPSTLFAGTRGISNNNNPPWNGVVYKSVDAGYTWTPVLADVGGVDAQDWVYSLAVDPNAHDTIYAATHEHGPYKSSYYGDIDTWYTIQNGINNSYGLSGRAIIISPDIINWPTLFYGVWHSDAVYKSPNGGSFWFPSNKDILWTKVYSISLDPTHVDTVYLATFNHGIMKTIDGGLTWQPGGLQEDQIYSLAINPISSANLLAGTDGDGLYRSTNSGSIWQHSNTGIDNAMVTSVVLSPTDPHTIYASLYGAGVFQTENGGQAWSEINAGLTDKFVHDLVMDPAHPGLLYAMTDTGGLFQNDLNAGNGWKSVGQGLPLTNTLTPAYPADHPFATREVQEELVAPQDTISTIQAASVNLLTMVYAPSDPHIAFIGTAGSGVYRSMDGGTSWQPAGLVGKSIFSLAVDLTDRDLVYAATEISGSIKISPDGGSTWIDSYLPVTFYSLTASPINPGVLYAGTSSGIYRYQSGTWSALGLSDQKVTAVALDPTQPDLIYAGTTSGAYFSKDGGLSWKFVDENMRNHTIQSITFDPTIPNLVYFSTNTHGIFMVSIGF
ncbi:MAG: hypothetical protein WAM09_05505 [Anaerolineales bacterium]